MRVPNLHTLGRLVRKYGAVLAAIAFILFWAVLLIVIPPGTITDFVGVENSYLIAFLITLIAGFSSFSGSAAYATVIELARSGANPLWLGIAGGVGLFLSDSLFYLVIEKGYESIHDRFPKLFTYIHHLIEWLPDAAAFLFVYILFAIGIIPNDLILLALLIAGYQYRKFWPFLLAGNITFMIVLSYLF
jgi:uncharacterized membrane protein YdjX (TVP38/TMEM64 family)